MNRIIEVKVCGNHITKDNKYAGVQGEANVTQMQITFDEGWDNFSKSITFFNAYGKNPVSVPIVITAPESIRTYLVAIPSEPLEFAGTMTFVLDGTQEDKKQRSVSDELEVKYSPNTDDAVNVEVPTQDYLDKLEEDVAKLTAGVKEAFKAKESIQNMTVSCETLAPGAKATVEKGENNGVVNLHYGIPEGEKGDTGDSGVYIGDTAPTDPVKNVWIAPAGQQNYPAVVALDEGQADVLKIKNDKGEWVNIPAITGESAYEIAFRDGFEGTEEEWLAYITPSVKEVSGGIEVTVGDNTVSVKNGTDGKDGKDAYVVTKMSELKNDMGYLRKNDSDDFYLEARGFEFIGGSFVIGKLDYGMSVSDNIIHSVGTPKDGTDAANKAYVDNAVPTKVSELINDNGYITAKDIPEVEVPTKLSQLEADSISGYELLIGASALSISGSSMHINKADYGFYVDGNRIQDVATPEDSTDAANKGYVDGLVGNVESALDSIIAMQNSLIGGDIS